MENPGRKEGRKDCQGRKEQGKEAGKENQRKQERKEDKKEGAENPYTLNPNPSHTNHTTTINNHNRKTKIK